MHYAFNQAITALGSVPEAELQRLSLLDSATILNALPDVTALARTRSLIVERIRSHLDVAWIAIGDLCEVFSALTALWQYDPRCVTADQLTATIKRMLRCEAEVGGPYYSGDTITVSANIQIALLMRRVAKPLPKVNAYLNKVMTRKHFESRGVADISLLYSLSKVGLDSDLRLYVADNWRQSPWQTPGCTAVALSVLKGELQTPDTDRAFAVLRRTQQLNGFWAGERTLSTTSTTVGSRILTTALVVEALAGYKSNTVETPILSLKGRHDAIAQTAKELFDTCAEPLRSTALSAVDAVCAVDKNFEILLLPHFFALGLNTPTSLTDRQDTMLSLANVYCWIAYTIYDDFLDDDGAPGQLPIANVALRAALDCYKTALTNQESFERYTARVFTTMDEANAWEVGHCRFAVGSGKITIGDLPKYGAGNILATRAFAHALGPMAILAQSPASRRQKRHVESAFRHYLIARQLNDDMRDWQRDVQTGQASYVVTAILRNMRAKPGTYDLAPLLSAMQKRFRQTIMPKIANHILSHVHLSRQAFAKSQLLQSTNDIYGLLDTLELSAEYSLDKHSKSQALSAGIAESFQQKANTT